MVKVISLSEEAYAILRNYKGSDMSFSDAIVSRFRGETEGKTEGTRELLSWIESQKRGSRKIALAERVDELLYGAKK